MPDIVPFNILLRQVLRQPYDRVQTPYQHFIQKKTLRQQVLFWKKFRVVKTNDIVALDARQSLVNDRYEEDYES